jgi:hypothetical protein
VAADKYAGHRGAQKGQQVNLGSRWQPATKRVRCANPNTSDAAFYTAFGFLERNFILKFVEGSRACLAIQHDNIVIVVSFKFIKMRPIQMHGTKSVPDSIKE